MQDDALDQSWKRHIHNRAYYRTADNISNEVCVLFVPDTQLQADAVSSLRAVEVRISATRTVAATRSHVKK